MLGSILARAGEPRGGRRVRVRGRQPALWRTLADAHEVPGAHSDRGCLHQQYEISRTLRSLTGWYLAASTDGEGFPEAARLALAVVLAAARLPWPWHGGEPDGIANELAVLLSRTAEPGLSQEDVKRRATVQWELHLRRGRALRRREVAVRQMTPAETRERIRMDELPPGELLGQGSAGFRMVLHHCSRIAERNAMVLKRLSGRGKTHVSTPCTVPMRALLEEEVVPRTNDFGDDPRQVLRKVINELSMGISW